MLPPRSLLSRMAEMIKPTIDKFEESPRFAKKETIIKRILYRLVPRYPSGLGRLWHRALAALLREADSHR